MEDATERDEGGGGGMGDGCLTRVGGEGRSPPELSSTNFIILATLLGNEIVGVGVGV